MTPINKRTVVRATGNGINWEPGKTEIVYLGVRNNGSLALKYNILLDIVDTPISPELLPASENDEIQQVTEDLVGPYELHDFFLYYIIRWGFSPAKVYRMAIQAIHDGIVQAESN